MKEKTINIPVEYKRLFDDDWREAAIWGGRYSLKSHTVARYLLIRARLAKTRVACFREFQNSITESSYQLLCDIIQLYELNDFEIKNNTIENTLNGSDFLFKGLWNNDQSIKSIEGVDVAWCFLADTKIGNKNIQDIKPDDYVSSYNHKTKQLEKRRVLRVMKSKSPKEIYILTSNGLKPILCTAEHPIYVKGKGYIEAKNVQINDVIYEKVKLTKRISLFGWLWRNDTKRYTWKATEICKEWWSLLLGLCKKEAIRTNEKEEPNEQSKVQEKNDGISKENWTQAKCIRWKWKGIYKGSKSFIQKTWAWLVERISGTNWRKTNRATNKLQNRFGECVLYARGRVRWWCSLWRKIKNKRSEKNYILRERRLDNIKIQKQRDFKQLGLSDGGDYVYNLEVEVNNNYFANGILVHNCEEAQTISNKSLEVLTPTIRKEGSKIIYTYNRLLEDDPVHNRLVIEGRPDTLLINVNYDIAIKYGFMPSVILKEIEDDKKLRPALYKHKWMGEPYGLERKIYNNWAIIDEIPHEARLWRRGQDYGYSIDPAVIVDIYEYNGGFIIDERLYQKGMSNKALADAKLSYDQPQTLCIADSSEPKSIDEERSYGVNIIGAKKGAGSVMQGIQYVQGQKISVTKRSEKTIKAYRNYMFQLDRTGKVIQTPDDTNHEWSNPMDAIRYGFNGTAMEDNQEKDVFEKNALNVVREHGILELGDNKIATPVYNDSFEQFL